MLVLFDIDGTLLRSTGVGMGAMREALESMHPGLEFPFDGIPIAGRLDTLIWRDLLARHAIPPREEDHAEFRRRYVERFGRRVAAGAEVRALPGAAELAARLAAAPGVTVGLLTGNYPETGRMKIDAAGFDASIFRFGAFAGDGPDRRSLVPVAMRRLREHEGRTVAPGEIVVIGDTPHDVDCAAAHGCRSLAVATGHHGEAELRAAGADLVAATLSGTGTLASWILSGEVT
jgi:phosphoglycolate phosphatase-like HAD superfamily hydrolase